MRGRSHGACEMCCVESPERETLIEQRTQGNGVLGDLGTGRVSGGEDERARRVASKKLLDCAGRLEPVSNRLLCLMFLCDDEGNDLVGEDGLSLSFLALNITDTSTAAPLSSRRNVEG